MEEIDFDVSNYDLNEILSILDWNNDVPLNPGMIKWKIREYKAKYKKAPKHVEFFEDVSERLLKEWEKKNKQEYVNTLNNGNAELDVKKILDDKYLGDIKVTRLQPDMSAADFVPPFKHQLAQKNDTVIIKYQ